MTPLIGWLNHESSAIIGLAGTVLGALIGGVITIIVFWYTEKYRKKNEGKAQLEDLCAEMGRNRTICLTMAKDTALTSPIGVTAWERFKNSSQLEDLPYEEYEHLVYTYLCAEAINHKITAYVQHRKEKRELKPEFFTITAIDEEMEDKHLIEDLKSLAGIFSHAGIVVQPLRKRAGLTYNAHAYNNMVRIYDFLRI